MFHVTLRAKQSAMTDMNVLSVPDRVGMCHNGSRHWERRMVMEFDNRARQIGADSLSLDSYLGTPQWLH